MEGEEEPLVFSSDPHPLGTKSEGGERGDGGLENKRKNRTESLVSGWEFCISKGHGAPGQGVVVLSMAPPTGASCSMGWAPPALTWQVSIDTWRP